MIDPLLLLQSQNPVALRDEIQKILVTNGLDRTCYSKILDYTVELFESKGLGVNYYGYHNIVHELEVTYVTLLAAQWESLHAKFAKEDFRKLGWFLSVADRIGGYALGDFTKAMEMAQKNAHALAWHPIYIVRRSVSYFEDLLNNEAEMCQRILRSLPREMRKNFMDNVLSFMKLREQEIQIEASLVYDNARFFANIEPISIRRDSDFIKTLDKIHEELPLPLQFKKEEFADSVRDAYTILNTLRLGSGNGPIVGFAKGGPIEGYGLRPDLNEPNYGMSNTAFLEPIAIRMGYWGQKGGREMRLLFTMQTQAKGYKYLASFALRDVISSRIQRGEQIEFTRPFNPERWDYYRIRL